MPAAADGVCEARVSRKQVATFDSKTKCRMSILRIVIRHCSRCAAKTELCVIVFRSLKALVSFDSKVFTAYPAISNTVEAREKKKTDCAFQIS
jgi:hypothetical protein